jgi:hypothetical protein
MSSVVGLHRTSHGPAAGK